MTQDPRALGFNYGAPVAEPLADACYIFAKLVAQVLRNRSSHVSVERSWALDMLIRDVRVSCSLDEQGAKLSHLKAVLGDFARHLRPGQHARRYKMAQALAWEQTLTWRT